MCSAAGFGDRPNLLVTRPSRELHSRSRVVVDDIGRGRVTSNENTGFIQSEAVRPYPMPRDLASLIKIAAGRTNDVRYRLLSLPQHLGPLLQYWRNSAPVRHEKI